jgi:hypothetical protein
VTRSPQGHLGRLARLTQAGDDLVSCTRSEATATRPWPAWSLEPPDAQALAERLSTASAVR